MGPDDPTPPPEETPAPAATPAETPTEIPVPPAHALSRLDEIDRRSPVYRDCRGYRLRLEPADLARLRELPGARGKSDEELGEAFFDGQAERLAAAVADDLKPPAELRVVVDPYSRQAFVALDKSIRGILSF